LELDLSFKELTGLRELEELDLRLFFDCPLSRGTFAGLALRGIKSRFLCNMHDLLRK